MNDYTIAMIIVVSFVLFIVGVVIDGYVREFIAEIRMRKSDYGI